MPILDPFTGAEIPAGTRVVRCPSGHLHLPSSWQAAGNRCCYPGCNYAGNPAGQLQAPGASPAAANVVTQAPAPLPFNVLAQGAAPLPAPQLDIRVIARRTHRRPWWPNFWKSLFDSVLTMVLFTATVAIGWSIVLSNAGAPSSVVVAYTRLDEFYLLFAAIAILASTLILTLVRVSRRT